MDTQYLCLHCFKRGFYLHKVTCQRSDPAAQNADILQHKYQPGSLVADEDQGRELQGEKEKGEKGS